MKPFAFAAFLLGLTSFSLAQLPPDSEYVTVDKAGHLSQGGKPIRLWGAIGNLPPDQKTIKGDPYYVAKETVRRLKKVGFNMVRDWGIQSDDKAKKGDLSPTDHHDFFIAECGRQGVKIWIPSIMGSGLYEDEIPAAAALGDPTTAPEWSSAVQQMVKLDWWTNNRKAVSLLTPAVVWDARLEAQAIAKARQKANHANLHNGLRLADNPTCAVWELTNEQWWMTNMTNGAWMGLAPYFRKELIAKWNAYLTTKYKDQAGLTKAWGFLFPGEDLAGGSVLLAPMANPTKAVELNDTNPAALAAFKGIASPIGRDQVTATRTQDVLEFFLDLLISHKKRCEAALKTWGKSCRLSPTLFDTGIGQSIQAQYMQMQGDAVSHASYMEGLQLGRISPEHKRYPFYSRLDEYPHLSNDTPWLEHNRPVGKPFLCYETQFGSPSKYRAEWPILIAALGSAQDWDGANYHFWSFGQYDLTKAEPYGGQGLAWPGDGAYQYDYTSDEVEQATMHAAGAIFRNRLVAAAPKPTLFSFGKSALYDPKSMDYGGEYGQTGLLDMMTTAYANGMRLNIDPKQTEFMKTEGPVVRFAGYEKPCPVRPSSQLEYDWQRAFVKMDSPGVACYTGFLSQYGSEVVKFKNGVKISNIQHNEPKGSAYPALPERYTSFTLASEDGLPLPACKRAVIALVSSSFNTGLKIKRKPDGTYDTNAGTTPILVTRVGAKIVARALAGMQYRMIDFNEKVLAEGVVNPKGVLTVPSNKPVWLVELTR